MDSFSIGVEIGKLIARMNAVEVKIAESSYQASLSHTFQGVSTTTLGTPDKTIADFNVSHDSSTSFTGPIPVTGSNDLFALNAEMGRVLTP